MLSHLSVFLIKKEVDIHNLYNLISNEKQMTCDNKIVVYGHIYNISQIKAFFDLMREIRARKIADKDKPSSSKKDKKKKKCCIL